MNKNIDTLRSELRQLAHEISTAKPQRKTVKFNGKRTIKSQYSFFTDAQYVAHVRIPELSSEFRHKHIAYCELRGTPRDQIEKKVKQGNEPDETYIAKLVYEYHTPIIPEEIAV